MLCEVIWIVEIMQGTTPGSRKRQTKNNVDG